MQLLSYSATVDRYRIRGPDVSTFAKLILAKEEVMTISWALELALFMDAKLDVSKILAS
jgi:hypothetical protein